MRTAVRWPCLTGSRRGSDTPRATTTQRRYVTLAVGATALALAACACRQWPLQWLSLTPAAGQSARGVVRHATATQAGMADGDAASPFTVVTDDAHGPSAARRSCQGKRVLRVAPPR